MNNLLFINNINSSEIIIIVLAILILFGGKKIPEFMRGLGKGINSFKKGLSDIEEEINSDPNEKEEK